MRAHLARLLADEPDLLMLDEPTNHLDLETLIWFQDYLQYYPGALMVISHDREFLNRLCTHTVEIRRSKLNRYTGNYDSYLVQCAANEEIALATQKSQQRRIDQLQEFVDRFGAKNTKAAQAQSKLKQIDRIREEMTDIPENNGPTMAMTFPQPQRSGQKVITLDNIHFAYGNNRIYEGIETRIERGERIVLVGPNGAGKSTLLKLLAGAITAQSGTRELGHNVRVGYYAQYRLDMLDASRTVLDEALDTPQRVTEQAVRTILGSFLFRGDDVFKKVKVLSGGEKSRLALVKLLLDPPNFLLMDEPTTPLDMPSIDALVGALKQYQGTLVFISHDVHFIRALANQVIHVRGGKLTRYPGDYQYYLDKTAQTERGGLTAGDKVIQPSSGRRDSAPVLPPADRKEAKRLENENREARAKQKRELKHRVTQLEAEIHKLEARQKVIMAELEKPDSYSKGGNATALNRELAELQDRLPVATAEWEKTAAELAPFDGETA
jgi:ATP-binding cassette subfamily F protein 3